MFLKAGDFFFKYRSYIPLPFLAVMLIFMKPSALSLLSGLVIALCGEGLRIWAVSYAGSETRTTSGVGGTYLVTQGPYAHVRNPLYIGNILIYTGIGIMSYALFPHLQIFAFLFFLFQYYCIILAEESFLQSKFGQSFLSYKNSTGRFLWGSDRISKDIKSNLTLNIPEGIRSEKRSLQAISLTSLIIVVYYFIRKLL